MIQTVCNGCAEVIPDGAFKLSATLEEVVRTMRNKFIVLRDQSFLEIPSELHWCFACTTAAMIGVKERNDQLKAMKEIADRVPPGSVKLTDDLDERPK